MKSVFKKVLWLVTITFLTMNAIAFIHAYKFTHFTAANVSRTKDPTVLSIPDKIKILLTGIDNPKPHLLSNPRYPFTSIILYADDSIKCWSITVPDSKGTVILFHGYAGEKSSLLGRADQFIALGYTVFLIDFIGSGESNGNTTSVGFHEARQVKVCFDYVKAQQPQTEIYLFGTSMGSVAILKAIYDFSIQPEGIILECPFGSLYKTVCARFDIIGVPSFPMAGLLTFWGGVQNGYWAFTHNSTTYAKSVKCPTLLLFGKQDNRVSQEDTQLIFNALTHKKTLSIYPHEGHQIFTAKNTRTWKQDVSDFLKEIHSK
jgi:alpha-beta hydrolase superfamily lysophospholipase